MQKALLFVDKVSTFVGHAFSFFIVALTLHVTWEVFRRYALDSPRAWAFDVMIYFYAEESWRINEHSTITYEGPPLYPFKTVIPVAGAFVLMQGIVEIIRCIACLRDGVWPSRVADVEEVDVDKLKAELHVKDEDIQKLDQVIAQRDTRA
jgi:TRAP-type mannitol/chloroaromatic compound transport system permease small subunit